MRLLSCIGQGFSNSFTGISLNEIKLLHYSTNIFSISIKNMKFEKPAGGDKLHNITNNAAYEQMCVCVCGLCLIYFFKFLSIYTDIFIKAGWQ